MIDTLKIFEQLSETMEPAAARKLAEVLGAIYQDLQNIVTKPEFLDLKDAVRELAQAQQRTEQRVEELAQAQKRTEQRVEELAQAQKRTEQRVEELAQAQKRTEQKLEALTVRVDELTQAQTRTEATLQELIQQVRRHDIRLAKLDGRTLEMEFRDKAAAYLGRVLRGVRVVSVGELAEDLEAVLTEREWADLLRIDVLVKGRAMIGSARQDVFVAVEVSVTLDEDDVKRAARRAALLRKKGWKALAVVAGEEASTEVIGAAAAEGVAVLQDGQQSNWEQALAVA